MTTNSRIVLRHDDRVASTVEEHRAIALTEGKVWWGWWRKDGAEPDGAELLAGLKNRGREFRVGLVNRESGEYWQAECSKLIFGADGARIPSPDESRTPAYYRELHCGAWFELGAFSKMSKSLWEEEFGVTPTVEATLFESRKVDGARKLFPRSSWKLDPVKVNGNFVLHISDIHFGTYHGFPTIKAKPGRGVEERNLADHLVDAVRNLGVDVGVVILSGDCISRGESAAFVGLGIFLEELAAGLGLEPRNFVIVPGNHDFHVLKEGVIPSSNYAHETDFRNFLDRFYGESHVSLERIQRFVTPSGWDLVFFALNSARLRDDSSREYGYVGRDRYEPMMKFALSTISDDAGYAGRLVSAVLHHHLLPVQQMDKPDADRPLSLTVDAAAIASDLQRHGVKLALHGHQHLPFIGSVRRALQHDDMWHWPIAQDDLFVLGMGSTGANAMSDELRDNSFGLYKPVEEGLEVTIYAFNPARTPRKVFSDTLAVTISTTGTGTVDLSDAISHDVAVDQIDES